MPFNIKLKVISEEDLARVHDASLKILEETGVAFQCEEALEIFKINGAKVKNKTVYLPQKMVEDALESAPDTFRWYARNEAHSVTLGEGYAVEPNVGPVYIQDLDNGRRLGKLEDYANIQKLCQSSDIVNLVGATPIDPSDVEGNKKHLYMLYETIKNTDKPVIGMCANKAHNLESLKFMELALGKEGVLQDKVYMSVSVNPLSPLAYGPAAAETIIEYSKQKQAIMILPCIMAGVTGPISLFGTVVLQNAEILAGIVLTQLINPGNPVVAGPCSSVAYMKKASYITGSPEMMLIDVAGLQMFLDLYKMPTRIMTGMTDSKVVDCQAGYETMQNMMLGILSGAHVIHECLGVLDSIMTTSYEKFIIDEELLSRVMRISEGLDTSEEAMMLDVIQKIGNSGSYLLHPSTFEGYRDHWLPRVSDWEPFSDWQNAGSQDVVIRANRKFKERLRSAPESLIDPELDKELKAFIRCIRKE